MKGIKIGIIVLYIMAATPLFSQGIDYAVKPKKIEYHGNEWFEGLVTYRDGKTIACNLSYNPESKVSPLKIKEKNKIKTAGVDNVKSFTYYDKNTSTEHKYFSFSANDHKQMFVELLYKDAFYSILGGRDILNKINVGDKNKSASQLENHYQRFLIDIEKGLMYDLTPVNLKNIMQDKEKEIKQFIGARKLQFKSIQDYTLVIKEYERLTR